MLIVLVMGGRMWGTFLSFSLWKETLSACQQQFSLRMGLDGGREAFSFHFAPFPVALRFLVSALLIFYDG